jgi:hypothetical protein
MKPYAEYQREFHERLAELQEHWQRCRALTEQPEAYRQAWEHVVTNMRALDVLDARNPHHAVRRQRCALVAHWLVDGICRN